jgi:dolichyl-phosphate beta-glucosyltransferase
MPEVSLFLSIVIPVYNEEKRVEKAVKALDKYLTSQEFLTEVIFVDDGSVDETVETIKKLGPNFNYRILRYKPNRGKGYAIKQGMLSAGGRYLLFMDVDMSTPIEEFDKFRPLIKENSHVLIGTRKTKGAQIKKRQKLFRQKLGEVFTLLSNTFIVNGVTDFTCGFKLFSREAGKKVFTKQKIERWGFDSEILFLANKHGYNIEEIPVTWTNDERTKVNLLKDVTRSLSDLVRIRLNNFRGLYDK